MKRVVVTGVGMVSPLADGVLPTWRRLLAGESGINIIRGFDASTLAARIAGEVPEKTSERPDGFLTSDYLEEKDVRKIDKFMLWGIAASAQAVEDSGWVPQTDEEKERTGVIIGSGIGGLSEIANTALTLKERGTRRVSPFFIPSSLINLVSGYVSIRFGFTGPNHSVVTACATGAHAIGDAARLIQFGDADVMVAGGAEAAVCPVGVAGFAAMRALSTRNDEPEKASCPWDDKRDGFVMGEGAGILVLESLEHAKARGAKIYGELLGYGLSGDAHHITAPASDGAGAFRAMRAALKHAKISPEDINYVNAHGTSTPLGDEIEVKAIKRLFGAQPTHLSVSSTKSSIGHLLGAAGSVEAIFTLLAMNENIAPPTLNLHNENFGLDFVPHVAKEKKIDIAMSNSFGFGGTNASLIFGKV